MKAFVLLLSLSLVAHNCTPPSVRVPHTALYHGEALATK